MGIPTGSQIMTTQIPRQKVLVVDDERVIADTLSFILNRNGYNATAVYSGEEAIQVADDFKPDVLICDVIMPGLNGIETAIHICHQRRKCRVVLISGHILAAELLDKAEIEGYTFEIVAKPVYPAEILQLLAGEKV